jgi:hypothetical protein
MQADTGEIVYAFVNEIDAWVRERERRPRPVSPAAGSSPGGPPMPALPGIPQQSLPAGFPPLMLPAAASHRVAPWLAGGGMLLIGMLFGWVLGRL